MTVTTISPTATSWIEINDAARKALRAAVQPTPSVLPAQFLGEGYAEGQQFEVVLGYFRWHVRIRLATKLHESGEYYEAILSAAYRESSAATSPAGRFVHHWKPLSSVAIADRRATEHDLASYLSTLRHELEHQPAVIDWVFRRRPY